MQVKTNKFIKDSKITHKDRYDYSKTIYKNARTKVIITCSEHGDFEQLPSNHKRGNGCPKCLYNKKDLSIILNEFKEVHGDKYDYSKVIYKNVDSKVKIICPEHGEFEQSPSNHRNGQACPKCVGKGLSQDLLIKKFKQIHGDKYDYSKVKYINNKSKIKIICPEHGEFEQSSNTHKMGHGCFKCYGCPSKEFTNVIFSFNKTHGDRYDYSLVDYKNAHTKIKIICPEHGEFKQTPNNHKNGNGCPKCNESKGEREIRLWLEQNNIQYIPQHKFNDCKNILPLPFDFYLPEKNVCIEYNGLQHYKIVEYFGGADGFNDRQKNDKIKMGYCKENNIPLVVINYNQKVIDVLIKRKW